MAIKEVSNLIGNQFLIENSIFAYRNEELIITKCNNLYNEIRESLSENVFVNHDEGVMERSILSKEIETLSEMFSMKRYSAIEFNILKALYTYKYLNSYNLTRHLLYSMPTYIKKTDFSYNLKRLYKDGFLYKHFYEDKRLVAYSLTESAFKYMAAKGITYKTGVYVDPFKESEHTIKVLEWLSIAQYHISLICSNKTVITKFMHKKSYRNSYVTIPSLAVIKADKCNDKFTFITMAIPRISSKNGYDDIMARLVRISGYVADNMDVMLHPIICLVADSIASVIKVAEIIKLVDSISSLPICYVLDSDTVDGDLLQHINLIDIVGEGQYTISHLDLINIKE